jgi:hypothetical protein
LIFKQRYYECPQCGERKDAFAWDTDPHPQCAMHEVRMIEVGSPLSAARNLGVIDDQLPNGPHWCETLGHEPVWVESKSQLRREAEARGFVNVVRRDDAYYVKQRKMHDEMLRDTKQIIH